MDKIRVLIVDDSVVVRRIVSDVLAADPALEIAGTAANGRIALAKIPQVAPDLVVLDLDMPEMDGLTALPEIHRLRRDLPVIIYSSLTRRGAAATLEALSLGARDYVTKPEGTGGPLAARQVIQDQLIPKVKALVPGKGGPPARGMAPAPVPSPRRPSGPAGRVELLAIGASTGGPNALADILSALPGDLPVPVVIVQHMPPIFTRMLAERLTAKSELAVHEAADGDAIRPGAAWIAPGDFHMTLAREGLEHRIRLNQGAPENSCRPSVDVLLRSAAGVFGPGVLALILTGMGQDGLLGCRAVRDRGGSVLVQDEATSVVWGMPGFVARAGLADRLLALDLIAPTITARARAGRAPAATP